MDDNAVINELQEKLRKLQATIDEAKKAQSRRGTRGDQPEREIDFKAITAAAQHIPKLARLPKSNFATWERHVMDVAYARAWPTTAWRGIGQWDGQEEKDLKARRARKEAFFLLTYTLDTKLLHLKVGLQAGDARGLMKKIDALFKSYTLDALERATDAFRNTSMATDNSSLTEYIAHLTERAEVLRLMGKPVDPQAMAARFLKGLPSAYTNIADMLGINRKLTFDEACNQIIEYAQQRSH